tara:strand:+ start:26756 stop:27385 length:630 start_codon:yes stop_codon:yes gene_type:complete
MANSEIIKEVIAGPVTVSRVYASDYQKEGTLTAELKQKITTNTTYPSKRVTNSLDGNVFSTEEFGFEPSEPFVNHETRVAWIDVPVGTSIEAVVAKLAGAPGACLYRIMDNKPVISDNQQDAIRNPERNVTIDTFSNRQAVRYPMGHTNEGKLAIHSSGKVQYRRIAFSATAKNDVDNRNADLDYGYVSAELQAEVDNTTVTVIAEQQL